MQNNIENNIEDNINITNEKSSFVEKLIKEIIQKLKNDGFELKNKLNSEYPYLTIKW